jgi:hypothetical protein
LATRNRREVWADWILFRNRFTLIGYFNRREVCADWLLETGEKFELAYECGEIPPVFKRFSIPTMNIPLTTINTAKKSFPP